MSRRSKFMWALALLPIALAGEAMAHPHVWIEMRSDIVFSDDGKIKGVNIIWTFDDNYTQMALDGLDTNGDGVYSQPELDPLTKENIASLEDYDFFTVMRFNGEKLAIGKVTEYGQIWSADKLQLHFQVPLKDPLDPQSGEFQVKVYDPDFFIAMDYVKDDPVSVVGNIPASCRLDVRPVPTGEEIQQTQQMLSEKGPDWKPENNEDFGAMFAQPVLIQCKA